MFFHHLQNNNILQSNYFLQDRLHDSLQQHQNLLNILNRIDFLNQHLNPGLRDTIRQSVQEKMLYIKRDSLLEQRLCDIADKVKGKRLVLDVLVRCVGAEIMSYLHNFNQSNEMKDEAGKESSFNIQ